MSELMLSAGRILLLLSGVYVLAAVGAHFISGGMIFPRPPVEYALTDDYLRIRTPDGVTLAARYWPNPAAKHTILYLHGNYEDLGSVGEYIPSFLREGYAVFAVDYRRYGHSEGVPTEANTIADALLAHDTLRDRLDVPSSRIVVFGYSLGGGPAIEVARQRPVAGVVLQGAFVSAYRVMTRVPLFPGDKFVNLAKVPALTCPVLIIHGTDDRTVPVWHGEALYAATRARKQKFIVPGGPHAGLADFAGPRYWEELKRFTESL